MEGIRQNQLDRRQISDIFWIFEHIEHHPLDSRLRADRHKNRGCQGNPIERKLSNPCISLLFKYLKAKFRHRKIGKN